MSEIAAWREDNNRERRTRLSDTKDPGGVSPPNWTSNGLLRYAYELLAAQPIASTGASMRNQHARL